VYTEEVRRNAKVLRTSTLLEHNQRQQELIMIVSKANKSITSSASSKSDNSSPTDCEEMKAVNIIDKLVAKTLASMARAERKAMIFSHPAMKLFTQAQLLKLQKNFSVNNEIYQSSDETIDFTPVVKLFTPDGACTWLLTELSPDLIAFGLCDLGHGEPEMGCVSLKEIYALRGGQGLPVERDRWFEADKTLTEYARLARREGWITV